MDLIYKNALDLSLSLFSSTKDYAFMFIGIVVLIKIVYANIFGDPNEFAEIFKGLILFFVLIYSYEYILRFIVEIPASFAAEIADTLIYEERVRQASEALPSFVAKGFYFLEALFFTIAQIMFILILFVLSALGPIIFILSIFFKMRTLNNLFWSFLILGACWPLIFASLGKFQDLIFSISDNSYFIFFTSLIVQFSKVAVTVFLGYASLNNQIGSSFKRASEIIRSSSKFGASTSSRGAVAMKDFGVNRLYSKDINRRFEASRGYKSDLMRNHNSINADSKTEINSSKFNSDSTDINQNETKLNATDNSSNSQHSTSGNVQTKSKSEFKSNNSSKMGQLISKKYDSFKEKEIHKATEKKIYKSNNYKPKNASYKKGKRSYFDLKKGGK